WGCPSGLFARSTEEALTTGGALTYGGQTSPSVRRALEALPEGGSVLDVGAGAGAASLPLCPPAAAVTAVDQSPAMLAAFADLADGGRRRRRRAWPRARRRVRALRRAAPLERGGRSRRARRLHPPAAVPAGRARSRGGGAAAAPRPAPARHPVVGRWGLVASG